MGGKHGMYIIMPGVPCKVTSTSAISNAGVLEHAASCWASRCFVKVTIIIRVEQQTNKNMFLYYAPHHLLLLSPQAKLQGSAPSTRCISNPVLSSATFIRYHNWICYLLPLPHAELTVPHPILGNMTHILPLFLSLCWCVKFAAVSQGYSSGTVLQTQNKCVGISGWKF